MCVSLYFLYLKDLKPEAVSSRTLHFVFCTAIALFSKIQMGLAIPSCSLTVFKLGFKGRVISLARFKSPLSDTARNLF